MPLEDPEINPIHNDSQPTFPPAVPPPGEISRDRVLLIETAVVLAMAELPYLYTSYREFNWGIDHAPTSVPGHFGSSLLYSVNITLPLLFIIWRTGERWSSFGIVPVKWLRDVLLAVAAFVVADLFVWGIRWGLYAGLPAFAYRLLWFSGPPANAIWRGPQQPIDYLLLIAECCISCFGQELFYRGYLIPRFERIFKSTLKAVLLSTLLFGAIHTYQGWYGAIGATGMGLVFALFFVRFRRLWPLAAAHALWNFIVSVHLH